MEKKAKATTATKKTARAKKAKATTATKKTARAKKVKAMTAAKKTARAKKAKATTAAKKTARVNEASSAESETSVVVAQGAMVINMSPQMQQKAKNCLKRTGKINISMKEISVAELPSALESSVAVD
jgi:hypothetical protein